MTELFHQFYITKIVMLLTKDCALEFYALPSDGIDVLFGTDTKQTFLYIALQTQARIV